MKKIKLLFAVCSLVFISSINAQDVSDASNTSEAILTDMEDTAIRNETNGKWLLIFGLNVIEDDGAGYRLPDPFDSAISHFSNPFVLGAEYYTNSNFSINASFSFNKYEEGKQVDNGFIQEGSDAVYFAFDVSSKYSFKEMLNTKVFDPYVLAGTGYTTISEHVFLYGTDVTNVPTIGRLTLNFGVGSNFWISDSWGLFLNLIAKHGVKQKDTVKEITNQLQLSFGGVYRI